MKPLYCHLGMLMSFCLSSTIEILSYHDFVRDKGYDGIRMGDSMFVVIAFSEVNCI